MNIAEKLTRIAENEQRVFDAGYLEGEAAGGYADGFEDGRNSAVDADKIIEATATGNGVVRLTEVSEVKHKVKVTTAAGVKVTTLGKNLLSDAVKDSNNWVRVEGISINSSNSKCYFLDEIPNGTFTISAKANSSDVYLYFFYSVDNGATWQGYNGNVGNNYIIAGANAYSITFTKTDATRFLIWHNNVNYNKDVEYIQVEAGGFATEYEPYITPTAYTADSNGIALVDSIAPNMTVITDGGMTVEYRKSWGMQAERDAFWDAYFDGLEKACFRQAFTSNKWGFRNFFPTRDIEPVGDASQLFYDFGSSTDGANDAAGDLAQRLRDCGVVLDTSKATSLKFAFSYARISCIPTIDVTGLIGNADELFSHTWAFLKKIEKIITNETVTYNNWFVNCTGLTDISFEGNIGNDINLQWSTKLSKDSIKSILIAADNSIWIGTPRFTVTLSRAAVNKAFETSEGANDGSESYEWTSWISNTEGYYTTTLI
jgi:hypothetical protein